MSERLLVTICEAKYGTNLKVLYMQVLINKYPYIVKQGLLLIVQDKWTLNCTRSYKFKATLHT